MLTPWPSPTVDGPARHRPSAGRKMIEAEVANSVPLVVLLTGGNRNDITRLLPLQECRQSAANADDPAGGHRGSTPIAATTTTNTVPGSANPASHWPSPAPGAEHGPGFGTFR